MISFPYVEKVIGNNLNVVSSFGSQQGVPS